MVFFSSFVFVVNRAKRSGSHKGRNPYEKRFEYSCRHDSAADFLHSRRACGGGEVITSPVSTAHASSAVPVRGAGLPQTATASVTTAKPLNPAIPRGRPAPAKSGRTKTAAFVQTAARLTVPTQAEVLGRTDTAVIAAAAGGTAADHKQIERGT